MSTKLYGTPIDSKLVAQLNYRKENLNYRNKNAAELMLDNNKGAYVSLTSGATEVFYKDDERKISVNRYPDLKMANEEKQIRLSNTLAQGNVLFGGTLYKKQLENFSDGYSNFELEKRGGISFNSNFDELGNKSSYDYSAVYGYRPMAGITNLSITYKSAFGSIREATVKIQANSPEQLSILDKLYFRPGYTMLLEWGNNSYIDGYGLISSFYQTFSKDFLQFNTDLSKLKEEIKLYREDTGFNYDGMIGKITNFDWSYQSSGVYDCSIKLISEGDLIEGIKTTYSKPKEYFTDKYNGQDQNDSGNTYDDKFLEILSAFKNDSKSSELLEELKGKGIEIPKIYKTSYDKSSDTSTANEETQRGHAMFHITLQDLLQLINKFILEEEDTGSTKLRFNTDPERSKMLTFVGHISGNPKTCVMPYRAGNAGGFDNTPSELDLYLVNKKGSLLNVIRKSPDNITAPDDSPLKILVSIDEVIAIQSRLVEAEAKDKTKEAKVAKFMNTLLDNISRDLGGINKLRTLYDKDTTSHIIVDENMPSAIDEGDFEIPTIDVVGLGSFATNVSIESKVSPNMTNTLAIAATAQGSSLNDSIGPLLKYNRGVTDRFDIDKLNEQENEKDDKRHPIKAKLEDTQDAGAGALGKAYRRIKQGIYSDQLFASTIIPHRRLMNALHDYIQLRKRGEGKKVPYAALIPIELTLELRGITGLKCGQAFTISDEVLPERYRGKVAFIITGIDHKVDAKNMWTTGITTTMIMLPSDEVVTLGADFKELKQIPKDELIKAINYDPPAERTSFPVPNSQKWPWSAAFISYCMKKADPSFPGSAAHTGYLEKIRKGHTSRYEILDADKNKPQVGDIIIQGRKSSGYLNFTKVPYSGKSHGDIVIKIDGNNLTCIGGNVNDSVRKKPVTLRNGLLKGTRGGDDKESETVTSPDGTLTFANQYTTIIRAKQASGINVGLITGTSLVEWAFWTETDNEGNKNTQGRDKEQKANQRDVRGEALFQRMKTYWEAAGYNNFDRNPGY